MGRQSERTNKEVKQVLDVTSVAVWAVAVLPLVPADVTGVGQEIVPV